MVGCSVATFRRRARIQEGFISVALTLRMTRGGEEDTRRLSYRRTARKATSETRMRSLWMGGGCTGDRTCEFNSACEKGSNRVQAHEEPGILLCVLWLRLSVCEVNKICKNGLAQSRLVHRPPTPCLIKSPATHWLPILNLCKSLIWRQIKGQRLSLCCAIRLASVSWLIATCTQLEPQSI